MAKVADLLITISGDSSQFRKEINAVKRNIKSALGSDAMAASKETLNHIKLLATGFVGAGVAAVKYAADMEQTITAYSTLLGSADRAKQMVKSLSDFAAHTPFEMPGITKSAQMLLAYGFQAEKVIPILTNVGNAVSGLGGNDENMQYVIRALGQIQAKGKLSAEEMKQLSEQGINAWKYLADAAGISIADMQEKVRKGAISLADAIQTILGGMGRQFAGGMEAQSKTISGLLSTVHDNAVATLRTIGEDISDALDLKGALQNVSNFLTQFSTMASASGIGEAIRNLVPDSVKLTIIGLAAAYTARLIPALYSSVMAAAAANRALLPLMGTAGAVAMAIAALTGYTFNIGSFGVQLSKTGAVALGAYQSINIAAKGISWFNNQVTAGLSFLPSATSIVAKMAQAYATASIKITMAGGAMSAMRGMAAGLGASLQTLAVSIGPAGWIAIVVGAAYFLTLRDQMKEAERQANITADAIAKINTEFANANATQIAVALDTARTKLADLEVQAKKTTAAMIEASNAAFLSSNSILGGNVGAASKKLVNPDLKNNLDEQSRLKAEISELEKKYKALQNIKQPKTNPSSVPNYDASATSKKASKDSAAEKAKRELEQLREEAKRTSETIEDQWIQMTGTQMDALNKWYADEIADLDKSKSVNANFERDKTRLDETYAEKRRKILDDENKQAQQTWQEISDGYKEVQNKMASGSLKGSALDLYNMRQEAESDYKSVADYFSKINSEYASGTKQQKADIIDSLNQIGVAYKVTDQDTLDSSQELMRARVQSEKQSYDEILAYYMNAKNVQSDIDAAYHANSFTMLQDALSQQNVLQLNNAEALHSLMETYEEARRASMMTTTQLMADLYGAAFSGLTDSISGFIQGTYTAEEALQSFGKTILKVVADFFAKKIAGLLLETIVGKAAIAAETLVSTTAAAAIAAAWAPAAAAVSLATFGANSGPAMSGMTATYALSQALSIPKFAEGGFVTGPTLAQIGEGRYNESVIQDSATAYRKIADGISKQGGNATTTVNVYGDINDASDEESIFGNLYYGMKHALIGA